MGFYFQEQDPNNIPVPDVGWSEVFYHNGQWKYKKNDGNTYIFATGITREEVEDILANSFANSPNISWVYDDANNSFIADLTATAQQKLNNALQPGSAISLLNNDSGFENASQLNARDTANRNRGNHTGTQLASTISNFASTVLNTILTGISFASSAQVVATDTVIQAIGKLQSQINNFTSSVYGTEREYQSSEGISSTSSFNMQNKLVMTTNPLVSGRWYRVDWYMEGWNTSINDSIDMECLIDGVQRGRFSYEMEDSNDNAFMHGFYEFQATSNGAIDIALRFSQKQGGTAQVQKARISKKRVE